jgi:hypothetical protein
MLAWPAFISSRARKHPIAGARRSDLRPPASPSGWACLQVIDLRRSGPGARTTFVAGVLPWCGDEPPTRQAVSGLAASEQGFVTVEVFTQGGLRVVDEGDIVATGLPSNFRDADVGTHHKVWGWRTAIRRAQTALS